MEIDKNKLIMMAPKERYEQQLDDVRWKFKADNIRIRDKHVCRLCGAKKTQLDVHHIRYIYGREAWDYDDGDLVTLCHKCHEEIHDWQDFEKLVPGSYFYDKDLKGVGIVEHKQSDGVWFHVCWTDEKHWQEDGHGRLFYEELSSRECIREATPTEIEDFWKKVVAYYNVDAIICHFGKHLKNLFPANHPIRVKARNRFKEALGIYEKQYKFIRETFNHTLLVSDDYYALLDDNRQQSYPYGNYWPSDELPHHYFKTVPAKDIKEKPNENNLKFVGFDELEFSKYRAATTDELKEWLDYEYHIANLHEEIGDDDLPF
jgi:hypothetical protein